MCFYCSLTLTTKKILLTKSIVSIYFFKIASASSVVTVVGSFDCKRLSFPLPPIRKSWAYSDAFQSSVAWLVNLNYSRNIQFLSQYFVSYTILICSKLQEMEFFFLNLKLQFQNNEVCFCLNFSKETRFIHQFAKISVSVVDLLGLFQSSCYLKFNFVAYLAHLFSHITVF